MDEEKLEHCVEHLKEHNDKAAIITTPWDKISGTQILSAMEGANTLTEAMKELAEEAHEHHEHEHHHDHEEHEEHQAHHSQVRQMPWSSERCG